MGCVDLTEVEDGCLVEVEVAEEVGNVECL